MFRKVWTPTIGSPYLIQKLEGLAGISGSRMPLGGPFLDQSTIDQIKSWIASGAPNNQCQDLMSNTKSL